MDSSRALRYLSIANKDITTLVTSTSVAEVARLFMEGKSTKQEGGSLFRFSQAFCGLVSSLVNSLEAFQDLGNMLELETAAEIVNGLDEPQTGECTEARPKLLAVVARTLKKVVETLVSDINANAEVQKLLPAILESSEVNHHAFFQDLMIPKQPSYPLDILATGAWRRL